MQQFIHGKTCGVGNKSTSSSLVFNCWMRQKLLWSVATSWAQWVNLFSIFVPVCNWMSASLREGGSWAFSSDVSALLWKNSRMMSMLNRMALSTAKFILPLTLHAAHLASEVIELNLHSQTNKSVLTCRQRITSYIQNHKQQTTMLWIC